MYSCIACIYIYTLYMYMYVDVTYQGMLEAARTKTRSGDFASPSICTSNSVFMRLLPSCSPLHSQHTCTSIQVTIKVHVYFNAFLWNSRPNCEFDNYVDTAGIDNIYIYYIHVCVYVFIHVANTRSL